MTSRRYHRAAPSGRALRSRSGVAAHGICLLLLGASSALAEAGTRIEKFGRGEVTLEMRATPGRVSLDRDLEVTLALSHPDALEVRIPRDLSDRFEGFRVEGQYEGETLLAGGIRHRTLHVRARPLPSAERYRIAPFAVQIVDPSPPASRERWFPTGAVRFEVASLLKPGETEPDGVVTDLKPIWIRPSARTVLRQTGWIGLAAAALALLAWAVAATRRRIRLARMAPRERALLELRELLARDLPGKGQAKTFYVELTRVVRRYIERRYGIRAPELTTEEFLLEATQHSAFVGETLLRLRDFLDAADLVKFAGLTATPPMIERSVGATRAYLENERSAPRQDASEARP